MIRLTALTTMVALAMPFASAATELRLGYINQNASPYLAGNGYEIPARPGLAVELVERVADRLGVRLLLTRMPARRMAEEVKAGRQDGILGFRYSAERAQDLIFPIHDGKPDPRRYAARLAHSLYRRAGSGITWDGRAIGGLDAPVAVSGTQLIAETMEAQGIEIIRVGSSSQMFGMLALGRVDAVVVLDIVGDRQVAEQAVTQAIEKIAPPVLIEDFYVPLGRAFYTANRDLCERFWTTIAELREATYVELMPIYVAIP